MPDIASTVLIRPFRAGDETTIALLKCRAIVAGELPGERESDVPRWTESLLFIGVSRAWRGRGLGRALLGWGISELRALGTGTISLRVESENVDALRLYERAGFITTHEWHRYVRAADQLRIDRQ